MKDGPVLWDFAVALYSSPGVEETVLRLQDEANANVNLLLWACWLQTRQIVLSENDLINAEATIARWDQSVVQLLRQLRRQLKKDETGSQVIIDLRRGIKTAELLAERHCLDLLASLAAGTTHHEAPDNLGLYLRRLGCGEDLTALREALSQRQK